MENMEQEPVTVAPVKKSSAGIGPVIGIIIIVILLALGGFYYFTTGVEQLQQEDAASQIVADEEEALREQSSSTDLADIEADLEATDFSGLDESSAGFDAELQ